MKTVISIAGVLILLYCALVLFLYLRQRDLLYHPDSSRPRPDGPLAGVTQIVDVPSHDGLGLFTWYVPPKDMTMPVVVYFHGNAGNQSDREVRVGLFVDMGWGVFLPTYRYNAGAGGLPSEAALMADAHRSVDWLRQQGISEDRWLLFGESLGTGVALEVATKTSAAAVILDSPYDSIAKVAAQHYWYVPVSWLLKDRFNSVARVQQVSMPVLIGHGGRDTIIPERHSRKLFEAASTPKAYSYKPDASHIEMFEYGFMDDMLNFLKEKGIWSKT